MHGSKALCRPATVLFMALMAACVTVPAVAAPAGGNRLKSASNVPTRITSDKMVYEAEKLRVVFSSKVHVQREDFELWADKLTVNFKPAPEKETPAAPGQEVMPAGMATGDVDSMVAERNVRMRSGERTGSCGRATYTPDKELIVMESNPRLSDGKNTITGNEIRHYAAENRSEVIGGGQKRVEAVFSAPARATPGSAIRKR